MSFPDDPKAPAAPAPDATRRPVSPPARERFRHWLGIATRWLDNDVYGHVNNVVYYAYFDTVVNRFLIEHGVLDPHGGDVIGLVVETGCRYHASLSFPDELDAGLRVVHLGRSSVRYEIGLFRRGASACAADGFFVHVYVDRVTRRPVPLPAGLREVLTGIADGGR